jgi:soluble lytic murein transglycosylase-like protein
MTVMKAPRPTLWMAIVLACTTQVAVGNESRPGDGTGRVGRAPLIQTDSPTAHLDLPTLCERARKGEVQAINELAWRYAYGKGVERNDAYAAYLFFSASALGHEGAKRMLASITWPQAKVPECMVESTANRFAPRGAPVAVEAPAPIRKLIDQLAPKYGIDPKLATAIIAVESNFDVYAISPKNAMGLMQLMPDTLTRFKVKRAFDPQENIRGGLAYLRWLLAYYQGDLVLAAAAYNAGEGAVDRHRGVPPFPETRDYVRKVVDRVGSTTHPFDAKVVTASTALALMPGKQAKTPN